MRLGMRSTLKIISITLCWTMAGLPARAEETETETLALTESEPGRVVVAGGEVVAAGRDRACFPGVV